MEKHGIRVRIDRERCIGAGMCVLTAPGVFQLDGESKSILLDAEAVDRETLFDAADGCPVEAIRLEDSEGRALYPVD